MNNDKRTLPYKITYLATMASLISVVLIGAFWMKGSPYLQSEAIVAFLKRPLYATELYAQTGSLSASTIMRKRYDNEGGATAGSVPVLVYHGIVDKPDSSTINFTTDQFKAHMFALKKAGYTTITPDELSAYLRGARTLPEKVVMLTFDDGRSDSYYKGDPILAVTNFTAAMYIIGRYTEYSQLGGYYLSTNELKKMQESGRWIIGSHSYDGHHKVPTNEDGSVVANFYSTQMWLPAQHRLETMREFTGRIERDLQQSKSFIEESLQITVNSSAFPFGDFGQHLAKEDELLKDRVVASAKEQFDLLMYQSAPHEHFTQNYPAQEGDSVIPEGKFVYRINMTNDIDEKELIAMLEAGRAKQLPFQSTMHEKDGWVGAWGNVSLQENTMILDANGKRSGAAAVLDGSKAWSNYRVSATARSQAGSSVVLWVRLIDENNAAACNFGNDFIHIDQVLDGEESVIRGTRGTGAITNELFVLEAVVHDRTLTCYRNGEAIVTTEFLDPKLSHGGIGFKTWNEQGNARATISSVSVEEVTQAVPEVTAIDHESEETQNDAQLSDD